MSGIFNWQVVLVVISRPWCLSSLFYLFIEKNWSTLCERIYGVIFLFGHWAIHWTDIFISTT